MPPDLNSTDQTVPLDEEEEEEEEEENGILHGESILPPRICPLNPVPHPNSLRPLIRLYYCARRNQAHIPRSLLQSCINIATVSPFRHLPAWISDNESAQAHQNRSLRTRVINRSHPVGAVQMDFGAVGVEEGVAL
jgi:hypothetical protein